MLQKLKSTASVKISDFTPLWRLGKPLFAAYLSKRYTQCNVFGDFPKPPFVLLANHLSALDPFIISAFSPYPIHWVANRLIFHHPTLGVLIRMVGAIPKQKNYPDPRAVKNIFGVVKRGGIVGIFPEGSITWSGNFEGAMPGTSKLVRTLGIPVVVAKIKGAWLAQPVWAESRRKGLVEVEISVYDDFPDEGNLFHSEWDWQLERGFEYRGEHKSRGIERIIWFCSECDTFRSVKALGDVFRCCRCEAQWVLDQYGFVEGTPLVHFMETQKRKLSRFARSQSLEIAGVLVSVRNRFNGCLKFLKKGMLSLSPERLKVGDICFPLSAIRTENLFLKDIFEFLCSDWLVRVHTGYSSFLLYSMLKELKKRLLLKKEIS
ncbi:MAG: 1-acyl-sn-glycerol-3-phosphate acyltransferase [Candidatus Atribacteria bacterium]|nr:1-acyl-sn-glycerol-3-phosphate acyltransferase [Candidatus Atribacteria bacterium]MCD6349697.1 1-acyl-sn-glycerol-3-phosphate acyltransferase [Candidatus Atribacteria bacterium]